MTSQHEQCYGSGIWCQQTLGESTPLPNHYDLFCIDVARPLTPALSPDGGEGETPSAGLFQCARIIRPFCSVMAIIVMIRAPLKLQVPALKMRELMLPKSGSPPRVWFPQAVFSGAQFLAETAHVRVHGAGVLHPVIFPHVLKQPFTGLNPAPALNQSGQQLEFGQRKLHGFSIGGGFMARKVQFQPLWISSLPGSRRAPAARPQAPDAPNQFARAERLGNVIIRAELETEHPVSLLPPWRSKSKWGAAQTGSGREVP